MALDTLPLSTAGGEDRALMDAIMSLPYKYREAVLLYYYQGLTVREMSEALGVAASTISTRLKKSRERLRYDLEGGHEHV